MIYFLALLPATGLTVAGYVVLFLAHRSEGAFRAFGKYLGFWAFTLAALVVLGAIFAAAHGGHHGAMFGERGMYGRMHGFCPRGPRVLVPGEEVPWSGENPPEAVPPTPQNPATPSSPASPSAH